jgi:hypothetical protein
MKKFLGLAESKEAFIASLPQVEDCLKLKYDKMKFVSGLECAALGHRYLFAVLDLNTNMVFGHVRLFESEFGVIDIDQLQNQYEKSTGFNMLVPFKETFKHGPKTMKELKEKGWDF